MQRTAKLLGPLLTLAAAYPATAQLPPGFYAAGDKTDNVLQYDCDGKFVRELANRPNVPGCGSLGIEFGPQGALYVVRCHWNAVLKWNDTTGRFQTFIQEGSRQEMHNLDFSPDGRHLWVAAGRVRAVRQYDARTGARLGQVSGALLQLDFLLRTKTVDVSSFCHKLLQLSAEVRIKLILQ